jgi:hypothetical protein
MRFSKYVKFPCLLFFPLCETSRSCHCMSINWSYNSTRRVQYILWFAPFRRHCILHTNTVLDIMFRIAVSFCLQENMMHIQGGFYWTWRVHGPPPAVERTRILPMTQHADNIWNEVKFLPLFTSHRRCWKCCPSTRRHSSHRRKRFSFTFWRFSAGIFQISLRMFTFSPSSVQGHCCKLCLSNNPRRKKKSYGSLLLSKHSTLMSCSLFC